MEKENEKLKENKINTESFDGDLIELNYYLERLPEISQKINQNLETLTNYANDNDSLKIERKKHNKKLARVYTSMALTLSLLLTGVVSSYTLTKKGIDKSRKDLVANTIYTKDSEPIISYKTMNYDGDKNYIKVYGPFDEYGSRTVTTYDVTSFNFKSVKEALNYNLDNLKAIDSYIESYSENAEINSETTVKQYIIQTLDQENYSDLAVLWILYWAAFVVIILIIIGADATAKDNQVYQDDFTENYYFGLFSQINQIKEILNKKANNKNELKENMEQLGSTLSNTLELIEQNEAYKNKFTKLFNNNIHLLNDPEILYRKFIEYIDEAKMNTILKKVNRITKIK